MAKKKRTAEERARLEQIADSLPDEFPDLAYPDLPDEFGTADNPKADDKPLANLVDELAAKVADRLKADGTREDETPATISVDDEDLNILRALENQAPRLCTLYEVETNADVTRKTAGKRLKRLIDQNLACRPNGEKRGATITTEGKEYLAKCPSPK